MILFLFLNNHIAVKLSIPKSFNIRFETTRKSTTLFYLAERKVKFLCSFTKTSLGNALRWSNRLQSPKNMLQKKSSQYLSQKKFQNIVFSKNHIFEKSTGRPLAGQSENIFFKNCKICNALYIFLKKCNVRVVEHYVWLLSRYPIFSEHIAWFVK